MNNQTATHVLYPELSYSIIGAAMDVHNKLGPGWDEEAYHAALLHALNNQGIKAESKLRGILKHHTRIAHEFELDILVEDSIVLELKHVMDQFAPAHYLQLINYLKFWNKDLGILINFGLDKLQYKRLPFTPVSGVMAHAGPWDTFKKNDPDISKHIQSIFSSILTTYGLGYSANVCKEIFESECAHRNIPCSLPTIDLMYNDLSLGPKPLDAFLVDSLTLISITALNHGSSAVDLARMLSYMRQLKISSGIIANFGQDSLELRLLQP